MPCSSLISDNMLTAFWYGSNQGIIYLYNSFASAAGIDIRPEKWIKFYFGTRLNKHCHGGIFEFKGENGVFRLQIMPPIKRSIDKSN